MFHDTPCQQGSKHLNPSSIGKGNTVYEQGKKLNPLAPLHFRFTIDVCTKSQGQYRWLGRLAGLVSINRIPLTAKMLNEALIQSTSNLSVDKWLEAYAPSDSLDTQSYT